MKRKRGYSREFTPRGERRCRIEIDKVPPTLYDAALAKVKREGTSFRALMLGWLKQWVGAMSIARLEVYEKCRYKLGKLGLGGGDWSDRDTVTHAVLWGRTLCGKPIGTRQQGWLLDTEVRHVNESVVSCRRCRVSLTKEQR